LGEVVARTFARGGCFCFRRNRCGSPWPKASNPTSPLQADIQQLRADFAKMTTDMRDFASNGVASANGKMWSEVRQKTQQIGQEIEERPFTAALATFSTGLILGMLLSARRR
jgi:ElaB/YqjD/DUF883 family membrane-anchored ribosome-binding protein